MNILDLNDVSKISRQQLGDLGEYKVKKILTDNDVYANRVDTDDRGIDFMFKAGHKYGSIQVKTIRKRTLNIPIEKLDVNDPNMYIFVVFCTDTALTDDIYVFKATEFQNPVGLLALHPNSGHPEYSFNFSEKWSKDLERHHIKYFNF